MATSPVKVRGRTILARAIREAWRASTSAVPEEWSPINPARGQCAVTALVVQDHCGGRLCRAIVNGESHYWNILDDGTEIDLTKDQFERFAPSEVEFRDRDYVLSFPDTRRRYELLRLQLSTKCNEIDQS